MEENLQSNNLKRNRENKFNNEEDDNDNPHKKQKQEQALTEDYFYQVSLLIIYFFEPEFEHTNICNDRNNFPPFRNHVRFFIFPKFLYQVKNHLEILLKEFENLKNEEMINPDDLFYKMEKLLSVEKDIDQPSESFPKLLARFKNYLSKIKEGKESYFDLREKNHYEENEIHLKRFYPTVDHYFLHHKFLYEIFQDIKYSLHDHAEYAHVNYYIPRGAIDQALPNPFGGDEEEEDQPDPFELSVENEFWWRKKISFHFLIKYWLNTDWKNSNYFLTSIWNNYSLRPIAFMGGKSAGYETLYNFYYLIGMKDGNGFEHKIMLQVNEGDADANTGIFGKVESNEGIWVTFQGAGRRFKTPILLIGDCGTYVKSFPLGNARFFPHENVPRNHVPKSLFYSREDYFETKSQVEKFSFTMAMLSLLTPNQSFPNNFPIKLKQSLMFSLLKIIQLKALKEENSNWKIRLPDEVLLIISQYLNPDFPMLTQKQIKYLSDLKRKEEFEKQKFEHNLCKYNDDDKNFSIFAAYPRVEGEEKNDYSLDLKLYEETNNSDFVDRTYYSRHDWQLLYDMD